MTSLSLKALECLGILTTKLFYTRYLISYDSERERLTQESRHKRLINFYFTWFLLTFILWPLATFYIVIYLGVLHPERVTYDRLFFSIIVSAPGFLCNSLNSVLCFHKHGMVNYVNLLLDLNKYWKLEGRHRSRTNRKQSLSELLTNKWQNLKKPSTRKDMDLVGGLLIIVAVVLPCIPIIYIPGPFLTRADPFSYPVQVLTGYDDFPLWLYIPFRFVPAVGAIICTMESVRAIGYVFFILVIAAHGTVTLLRRVERTSKTDLSTGMEEYALMYRVHVKSARPGAPILFVTIQGGIFIAVISLAGTMVGWKILSPLLYFLNPLMATFAIIIIAIAMPFATYSAELSLEMLKEWRLRIGECSRGRRAWNLRVLRSFQPMAFYMTAKGYLFGEYKTKMFDIIIMNTVDTILMIMDFIN